MAEIVKYTVSTETCCLLNISARGIKFDENNHLSSSCMTIFTLYIKKVTIQKKNEMIKVKVAHYTLKEILKTADVVRNLNTQNPIDKRDLNA